MVLEDINAMIAINGLALKKDQKNLKNLYSKTIFIKDKL